MVEPITITEHVDLAASDVLTVSLALVNHQAAAWMPGADTFSIFTGLAFYCVVFGMLSVIVAMVRLRWAPDDPD